MEAVRGERPGSFANKLFSALLRAALASEAASGAVVGLLLNKYLANADVRCSSRAPDAPPLPLTERD